MSIKIVKGVRRIGQATFEGLSFPESALLHETKAAFEAVQAEASKLDGVTYAPAIISIIVEQEILVNDDED